MPIEFQCPECQQNLRVPDDSAGRNAKCPKCGSVLLVPTPKSSDMPIPGPFGQMAGSGGPFTEAGGAFNVPSKPVNPYSSPQMISSFQDEAPKGPLGHQVVEIGDVLNYSIAIWKTNLGLLVGAAATVIGITYAVLLMLGGVQLLLHRNDLPDLAQGIEIVGQLVINVLQMYLGIGQVQIALKLARRQRAEYGDLFRGGSRFLPVLGLSLLSAIPLTIGFLLCIVPGVFLILMFWPAYYLLVDGRTGLIESFSVAPTISKGNYMTAFLVWLTSIGIIILGIMALCVGILFAAPLITVMWATAYLMMSGQISTQHMSQPFQQGAFGN